MYQGDKTPKHYSLPQKPCGTENVARFKFIQRQVSSCVVFGIANWLRVHGLHSIKNEKQTQNGKTVGQGSTLKVKLGGVPDGRLERLSDQDDFEANGLQGVV